MKIAIIGLGWVGKKLEQELISRGHKVFKVGHIGWRSQLKKLVLDFVVNCAGYTGYPNVDGCEKDRNMTLYSNAIFPIEVFNYCEKYYINYAHFSSGCIYSGQIDRIYEEPNFFGSTYSISKGISDNYLKSKCLLFRVRMPFSSVHEPKNYLSKVYNYAKNGKLYNGGQNSLTNIDEAVKIACDLIEQKRIGPFNLVNQNSIDMKQLVEMMELKDIEWYSDEEFKSVTKCGRSNCTIPTNVNMIDIEESLVKAVHGWKIDLRNKGHI